jgi:chromosomal replication initiator protein
MVKDCDIVWDNCLALIRQSINPQSYKTWFEPIKAVKIDGNALTIQVPNKFFYEWIEEHYLVLLKKTIRQELGENGRLDYQIVVDDHRKISKSKGFQKETTPITGELSGKQIPNPFVIPGIKKTKIDSQLNPHYTLEGYVEGDCNRLARSAGVAISKNPGGTAFNPLVIFGSAGLGKTHLAQAIGNEIGNLFPNTQVLYVTTDKFTNQIIQSIKSNSVIDFVNFYQMIDVLIVDDIHFLSNKLKTQEIFFNIFNQLHQSGKQIILTMDRAPKDLIGIEERLISRFKWGLTTDLQKPDLQTRIDILRHKMERQGVELPDDVVEYICYNVKGNIRELEGVLISLVAQSSLNQRSIDISLAKDVLQNFVEEVHREMTIDSIKKLVAEHMGIPVEKLGAQTRKRDVVMARQLAMYFAKNFTNQSLKAIGDAFGGRDHSTVIYSCKSVQDLSETDNHFRKIVTELEKKIKLSLTV